MTYKPTRLDRQRIKGYRDAMEGADSADSAFFGAVAKRMAKGYASRAEFVADVDECDRRYVKYRETLKRR